MFTKQQLAQLQKLFGINNKQLRKDVTEDNKRVIEVSEENLKQYVRKEIEASEKRIKTELSTKIDDSQKDTITVLMDAIHTGYNLHDKRIIRLEEELELSPMKH